MNVLFSHLGLLLLVIGYAVGGSYVFMALEKDREDLAVSQHQHGIVADFRIFSLNEILQILFKEN